MRDTSSTIAFCRRLPFDDKRYVNVGLLAAHQNFFAIDAAPCEFVGNSSFPSPVERQRPLKLVPKVVKDFRDAAHFRGKESAVFVGFFRLFARALDFNKAIVHRADKSIQFLHLLVINGGISIIVALPFSSTLPQRR